MGKATMILMCYVDIYVTYCQYPTVNVRQNYFIDTSAPRAVYYDPTAI